MSDTFKPDADRRNVSIGVSVGTRLSSQLYNSFVDYLQNGSKTMPSKYLLDEEMTKTMNASAKKTNNTIRKKFRNWTTKKVIIPQMDYLKTIKSIHESTPEHLTVSQTVRQIKSRFSWTSKNFGMNLTDVLAVLCDCDKKLCRKRGQNFSAKRKTRFNGRQIPVDVNQQIMSVIEEPIDGKSDNKSHSERCIQLFDELVSRIHSMATLVNPFRICPLRRHSELKESSVKEL